MVVTTTYIQIFLSMIILFLLIIHRDGIQLKTLEGGMDTHGIVILIRIAVAILDFRLIIIPVVIVTIGLTDVFLFSHLYTMKKQIHSLVKITG